MLKQCIFLALLFCLLSNISFAQYSYPGAKKTDYTDDYHGVKVADPYHWMEDDNSAETKAWVEAENKITFDYLSKIPYRDDMKQRIQEVYNYPKYTAPFRKKEYFYYYRNNGLQNQSVLYRQKGLEGKEELVMDPNKLSPDGTTRLTTFSLSKDGKYGVWGISRGGSDWQTYYVRDMETGKDLPDSLLWIKVSGVAWQGHGFYYSRYPAPEAGKELLSKNENHQVWFHQVGTSQDKDELIYEDKANPQRFHTVSTSEDERFAFLNISDRGKGFDGNALFYRDGKNGNKTFQPVVSTPGQFRYSIVDNIGEKFLLETNDGAKNSKIVLFDPASPAKENWKVVIPEKTEPLQNVGTVGKHLYASYLKDVTTRVIEFDYTGKMLREVSMPGLGTAGGFGGDSDDTFTFYTFNSFTFPPTIYRYDIS